MSFRAAIGSIALAPIHRWDDVIEALNPETAQEAIEFD
jgi:hypothetical protein